MTPLPLALDALIEKLTKLKTDCCVNQRTAQFANPNQCCHGTVGCQQHHLKPLDPDPILAVLTGLRDELRTRTLQRDAFYDGREALKAENQSLRDRLGAAEQARDDKTQKATGNWVLDVFKPLPNDEAKAWADYADGQAEADRATLTQEIARLTAELVETKRLLQKATTQASRVMQSWYDDEYEALARLGMKFEHEQDEPR
jgi:hypothetical protein